MYAYHVIDDDSTCDAPDNPIVGPNLPMDSAPTAPPPPPQKAKGKVGPHLQEWRQKSANFYVEMRQKAKEMKHSAGQRHAQRKASKSGATSPVTTSTTSPTTKPSKKERLQGITDATVVKLDHTMNDARRAMEKGKDRMRQMKTEAKDQKVKHQEEGIEPEPHRDDAEVKKDFHYAKEKLRGSAHRMKETVKEMVGEFRRKDDKHTNAEERHVSGTTENVH